MKYRGARLRVAGTSYTLIFCIIERNLTFQVSIIPRGKGLGYAQYLPKEQYLYSTEQVTSTAQ